jgi:hypothetical protein
MLLPYMQCLFADINLDLIVALLLANQSCVACGACMIILCCLHMTLVM